MRKQGLVNLHALCRLLYDWVESSDRCPSAPFEESDPPQLSPKAIHRPKAEHRRAVESLLDDVVTAVEAGGAGDARPTGVSTDGH